MSFDDCTRVVFRNYPDGYVAEIPAIAGCHALAGLANVLVRTQESQPTVP